MKKTIVSLFCVLALCLGLLPTAALAEGEDTPDTLWVGETQITASGYWTTDAKGKLSAGNENNYNVYYDGNGTLTLKDATIQGRGNSNNSEPQDYGIYAAPTGNQSVSLTIKLIGSNTVKGDSGIYVGASGGDSTLVIQSDGNDPKGSLEANGSGWNGITISSDSGNASLTINNASVVANSEKQSSHGVSIMSRSSTELSLTVNGGSLTAKGTCGIFYSSFSGTNPSTSLTVSDSALIKAIPNISASVASKPTPQGNGIVFDGNSGTVYGDVTLDNPLTVGEGETLTIPEGSALNGNNLTNNGTVTIENGGTLTGGDAINNGGTINVENGGNLEGKPTGSGTVVYAPTITTQPAGQEVTVGKTAEFSVTADGGNLTYQWQQKTTDSGATWTDISGANKPTYTTEATALNMNGYQYQCVVSNTAGTVTSSAATLTVNSVPVTGVTLDKNALSLVEGETDTLNAIVKPDNATDKTVTWSSDAEDVATVDATGKVTALKQGEATITATANGGSGISATCEVTVEPKTYTIQVAPAELTFDAVQVGYTQPAAQTVTITNTGNQTVTLNQPTAANFQVGALSKTELQPGETATFTVQPKAGLAVGEYKEELTVSNQNAGEVKLTLTFKVNPVLVSGLTLNQNTLALFAGDSATLTAAVTPENATNKTLTWSSSNTAVATVDQSGKVTAVAPGTAAITVTTNDGSGKVASCPVTVTAKTYALTIDPAAIGFGTVQPGYTQPAAREITVRNTGNQTLTLTQPTATKYLVGSLSRLTLAPGETATFTVQPKADQPVAVYNETILVVGNGGAGASLNLSFTVEKASGTSSGGASSSSSATTTTEKRTLHFDTNGGLPLDDVVRGLGAPVELWPYTPVRAGYLFQGWYADQALTRAVSSVVLTKDTTIYAKWAVDPAATAAPSGSGSGSGSGSSGSSGKGSGSQGGTTITVTPAPTASPTPTPEPTATPTPEPTATPEASAEPETDTDTASFPVVPVAAGVIVLVVLVGGIAIYRRFHD